jgi:hypothetical protein
MTIAALKALPTPQPEMVKLIASGLIKAGIPTEQLKSEKTELIDKVYESNQFRNIQTLVNELEAHKQVLSERVLEAA